MLLLIFKLWRSSLKAEFWGMAISVIIWGFCCKCQYNGKNIVKSETVKEYILVNRFWNKETIPVPDHSHRVSLFTFTGLWRVQTRNSRAISRGQSQTELEFLRISSTRHRSWLSLNVILSLEVDSFSEINEIVPEINLSRRRHKACVYCSVAARADSRLASIPFGACYNHSRDWVGRVDSYTDAGAV